MGSARAQPLLLGPPSVMSGRSHLREVRYCFLPACPAASPHPGALLCGLSQWGPPLLTGPSGLSPDMGPWGHLGREMETEHVTQGEGGSRLSRGPLTPEL